VVPFFFFANKAMHEKKKERKRVIAEYYPNKPLGYVLSVQKSNFILEPMQRGSQVNCHVAFVTRPKGLASSFARGDEWCLCIASQ